MYHQGVDRHVFVPSTRFGVVGSIDLQLRPGNHAAAVNASSAQNDAAYAHLLGLGRYNPAAAAAAGPLVSQLMSQASLQQAQALLCSGLLGAPAGTLASHPPGALQGADGGAARWGVMHLPVQQAAQAQAQAHTLASLQQQAEQQGNGQSQQSAQMSAQLQQGSHLSAQNRAQMGQVMLNAVLSEVLSTVLQRCKHAAVAFQQPVSPAQVTDYYRFVSPDKDIHLAKVMGKLQCGLYRTADELRADMEQIYLNTVAYHSPGHGQQACEALIPIAKELLDVCCDEMVRNRERLWAAEDLIKPPGSAPGGVANKAGGNGSDSLHPSHRASSKAAAATSRSQSTSGAAIHSRSSRLPAPEHGMQDVVTSPAGNRRGRGCVDEDDMQQPISPKQESSHGHSGNNSPINAQGFYSPSMENMAGTNLDALVAACEMAAEREKDDVDEDANPEVQGPLPGIPALCKPRVPKVIPRERESHEACNAAGMHANAAAVASSGDDSHLSQRYRRHKSKVFIRPNKVVYLPTTFMEDNFDPASLPINCLMVVEADGAMQAETHSVTIKAVPRQGLSTMYCMTNVLKFQQQYLNWQILNWTKLDNHHIKIHLQAPAGMVKRSPSPPPVAAGDIPALHPAAALRRRPPTVAPPSHHLPPNAHNHPGSSPSQKRRSADKDLQQARVNAWDGASLLKVEHETEETGVLPDDADGACWAEEPGQVPEDGKAGKFSRSSRTEYELEAVRPLSPVCEVPSLSCGMPKKYSSAFKRYKAEGIVGLVTN